MTESYVLSTVKQWKDTRYNKANEKFMANYTAINVIEIKV